MIEELGVVGRPATGMEEVWAVYDAHHAELSQAALTAVQSLPELHDLVERLGSDEPRSVRVLLVHELARHCLSQDVIRCVAKYHDEEIAQFWLVQTAA